METMKLRFFTTVAEMGSLSKASEILAISHSGLSKAISSLENENKIKLFRPLGRGLEITPEGQWFYAKAKEIIKIADEMMLGPKTESKFTKIGLSETIASSCASLFAGEFDDALSLMNIDVGEAEGRIVSGELDFAIAFTPSPRPELAYLRVADVRFCAMARRDLLERFPQASEIPFAVPSAEFPQNPLGYKNRDGWQGDSARFAKYFVSHFGTAMDLLRSGKAAVYMPEFVGAGLRDEDAGAVDLTEIASFKGAASKRSLYLIKTKATEESRDMKKICKVLRKVCARSAK